MCRAWTILNTNPSKKTDVEARKLMMQFFSSAYGKGNKDGYYACNLGKDGTGEEIKTMSYLELNKWLNEQKFPHVAIGHARKQTVGAIDEENIHGWQFKEWTAMCNGTVTFKDGYGLGHENDSKAFFMELFEYHYNEDPQLLANNMVELIQEIVEYGSGTFFLVNEDYTIVVSFGLSREISFHKINNDLIAITSKDDVMPYTLKKEIAIELTYPEETVTIGEIELKSKQKNSKKYKFDADMQLHSHFAHDEPSLAILFDNKSGEVIEKSDLNFRIPSLKPSTKHTGPHITHNRKSYYYTKGEEKKSEETDTIDQDTLKGLHELFDSTEAKYRVMAKELTGSD